MENSDALFKAVYTLFGLLVGMLIGVCIGREVYEPGFDVEKEAIIKNLNNEIDYDTIYISPNGKILDIKIKK